MAKSALSKGMDNVQQKLGVFLKEKQFSFKGRTYNRRTSDGLTHVISFQMGRLDPPGTMNIPGLREKCYGKFTVNVGVYVPEVAIMNGLKVGKFVGPGQSCVDERLGVLGPEHADIWWKIPDDDDSKERVTEELRGRLESDAFPFLARFETRDAFLKEMLRLSEGPFRARIDGAIILAARGQLKEAREVLTAYRDDYIRGGGRSVHLEYLEEMAVRLGIDGWKET